jgi:uncharacterized protein (DUF58 family)
VAVRLAAGEERTLAVPLTCRRWGAYALGEVHLRAHDRFRLFTWERHLDGQAVLKVFPVPDALRALVRPFETQVSTGSHVAAQRGDGIEFADLRPFLPGDRPRSINWRATARRGALMVNQRHPERATDVVLFLDSFLDVRGPPAAPSTRPSAPPPRWPRPTCASGTGWGWSASAGSCSGSSPAAARPPCTGCSTP